MLRPLLGDQIDLRVISASDIRPVYADPGQIEGVIMNLVLNARGTLRTAEPPRSDPYEKEASIEAKIRSIRGRNSSMLEWFITT